MATAKQTKKTTVAPTTAKSQDDTAREILDRKADVRRAALTTRQELRPAARSNKSREICNSLIEELRSSGIKGKNGQPPTLAVYAALRYEVDLDRFIRGAYAYGYRIVPHSRRARNCAPPPAPTNRARSETASSRSFVQEASRERTGSRQPWPSTPPCVSRSTSTASSAAPMPTDTAAYFRA